MNSEGKWVYGIDAGVGGHVTYMQPPQQFGSPAEAIRAAYRTLGLNIHSLRLIVGRLVRPAPPYVEGARLLFSLFKERYNSMEGVMYMPEAESAIAKGEVVGPRTEDVRRLETQLNSVLMEWFSDSSNFLGWYEVVDEQEVSAEDLYTAVMEGRETQS